MRCRIVWSGLVLVALVGDEMPWFMGVYTDELAVQLQTLWAFPETRTGTAEPEGFPSLLPKMMWYDRGGFSGKGCGIVDEACRLRP
ncbi:hypothetical protein BDP55DRAFT_657865 [Colletotrichum godetiae]|uniref:Uncharacterized protein n=1 Tax=Colletotrichum godetiae TaxID=1209918 RepID=A0AAJ0EVN6_9PEZI|nr:uncharacterized protein BDP55DRAFT_657865 [Colletotrichum godetiae]KAK1687850.1 hypothetical protein BDP55DRAFT_657865 [Colletotrichum godetiae]